MSATRNAFTVIRSFSASRENVFNAFATAEALGQWWGPKGADLTVIAFEFKPGGRFRYRLDNNGPFPPMWAQFTFKNIDKPNSIEFISAFTDEAGNISTSPFPMDFPLEVHNFLTFTENKGETTIRLEARPLNASAEQEKTFYSISENMQEGYNGTMEQLEEYLSRN